MSNLEKYNCFISSLSVSKDVINDKLEYNLYQNGTNSTYEFD